jgi:hypothetical protein
MRLLIRIWTHIAGARVPWLLQYVDDLLLAAASEAECRQATGDLLQELGKLGYRASAKKAQICRQSPTWGMN